MQSILKNDTNSYIISTKQNQFMDWELEKQQSSILNISIYFYYR